jgi:hypothetical protein
MEKITTEPTLEELNQIYSDELTVDITIDGHHGSIYAAPGGYGDPAIRATFGDIEIFACERECEDYEQEFDDIPDTLEVYLWQREDDQKEGDYNTYYFSLSNALTKKNPQSRGV